MSVVFKKTIISKPKYVQVAESLRKHILKGKIKTDEQIPNELVLSKQFNVSRNTVRDAIALLISDKLLDRQRGRGTFVKEFVLPVRRKTIMQFLLYKVGNPFDSAFSNAVYTGVREKIKEHADYELEIKELAESVPDTAAFVTALKARNVGGIILLGRFEEDLITACGGNVPLILTGKVLEDYQGCSVTPDNAAIMDMALAHLFELGHRRVCYLPSFLHHSGYQEKLDAFISLHAKYCERYGCGHEPLFEIGDYEDAMEKILRMDKGVTGVIASSDGGAVAALKVLKRHGFKVPEEVSLIALDDLGKAILADPPISVVDVDNEAIGRESVAALVAILEQKATGPRRITVPATLVVRESTAAAIHTGSSK